MTRIVSGFAGSLRLSVPSSGTRPTSDRVREAMFSALEARELIRGAHVLDLYAGSGALGLEAASRGAASVTLVERNAGAAKICRANVAAIARAAVHASASNAPPLCEVVLTSVRSYLERASANRFDLVFLDPPYDLGDAELMADLKALVPLLAADASVILERSTRSQQPTWPCGLVLERRRDYGETVLWSAAATTVG